MEVVESDKKSEGGETSPKEEYDSEVLRVQTNRLDLVVKSLDNIHEILGSNYIDSNVTKKSCKKIKQIKII
jgi:hypothetical protein